MLHMRRRAAFLLFYFIVLQLSNYAGKKFKNSVSLLYFILLQTGEQLYRMRWTRSNES